MNVRIRNILSDINKSGVNLEENGLEVHPPVIEFLEDGESKDGEPNSYGIKYQEWSIWTSVSVADLWVPVNQYDVKELSHMIIMTTNHNYENNEWR